MRMPRVRLTVRRMMVVVAALALVLGALAFRERAIRRAAYLAQATQHRALIRHWEGVARNRMAVVPNCLKLARETRQWRPVSHDPGAERQAVIMEERAAKCYYEAHLFLARANYHRVLAAKYESAAGRPYSTPAPDPPPPPTPL